MTDKEKDLKALVQQLCRYFWIEQEWEYFRTEFFDSNIKLQKASEKNAAAIGRFLKETADKYPDYKEIILTPKSL